MIEPFNLLNPDVACLGNHDLDHGIEHAKKMLKDTDCPWVMSNILDIDNDNKPVAGCEPFHINFKHKDKGMKLGIIGLADAKNW